MKTKKRFVVALLAISIIVCVPAASADVSGAGGAGDPQPAFGGPAEVISKDEVIYARLFENGEVRSVYAVNHFSLSGGGSITDHGSYISVVNLTDLQTISLDNGTVTARANGDNFYYQGNLADNDLPWLYRIEYRLGGAEIQPAALAGESGSLEIRIYSTKNNAVDDTFYNNYMQQISITLSIDNCANIAAGGATVANMGKNRVLVFTILPKQNAEIVITADVVDFEMAGIDITAMPFSASIEIPGFDGMIDDFAMLADAVAQLNDGVEKLKEGAAEIASGSAALRDGSFDFYSGLSQLGNNSGQLTGASGQIMEALSLIASFFSGPGVSTDTLAEMAMLPGVLSLLADGLGQISAGMRQLSYGYSQAYAALEASIEGLPDHIITEAQLLSLYAKADADERATLGRLMESYIAAMTVKGTHEQARPALSGVSATLDALSASVDTIADALRDISARISGALSDNETAAQLNRLAEGMSELLENYAVFHSGLESFARGVSVLADGYAQIDEGIEGLASGLEEMSGGIGELLEGAGVLAEETSGMPEQARTEIEALVSDYAGSEFEPVSFTSSENADVSFVQFVFRTEGIFKPAVDKTAPVEAGPANFWDRLINLFR